MNTLFVALVLGVVTGVTAPSAAAAHACEARVVHEDTTFPMRSQLRGQEGTVTLAVVVDKQGRITEVDIVGSSGYRLLDRAARESALANWEFDVSACERKDLPIKQRIAVEYRNGEY